MPFGGWRIYSSGDYDDTKINGNSYDDITLQKDKTCSMGAAFMPKDGTTFGELYKHADEALYTTKRNGRDGFRIYHEVEEKEV